MAEASEFYAIHKERPFFGELVSFMTSGPIVAAVLEKDNAEDFRTLIGSTDPKQADAGTIRADFADSIEANAVHGSDSDENTTIEGQFFFGHRASTKINERSDQADLPYSLLSKEALMNSFSAARQFAPRGVPWSAPFARRAHRL